MEIYMTDNSKKNDEELSQAGSVNSRAKSSNNNMIQSTEKTNSIEKGDEPDKKPKIVWSKENELIMVEWCDVAQCYKWLNSRAHLKYAYMNAWFTIPAIVLSTVSGTASFAQSSIPVAYQTYAPMAIGSINILIGILTTIQQYLKIAELNESHRVSAISWDKFARNIRIELAKSPAERADAGTFIKMSRQEFDRLMETSPAIPQVIVRTFKDTFSGKKNCISETLDWCLGNVGIVDKEMEKRKRQFEALNKPDICDIIVTANENRHKWYEHVDKITFTDFPTDDLDNDLENNLPPDFKERELELRKKEQEIHDKEIELRAREVAEKEWHDKRLDADRKAAEAERIIQHHAILNAEMQIRKQNKAMDDFVKKYTDVKHRKPTEEEIREEFSTIDNEILNAYLEEYKDSIV